MSQQEPNYPAASQDQQELSSATEVDRALPGESDGEGWRRLHPLTPLIKGGAALLVIVGIAIANLRDWIAGLFTDRYTDLPQSSESSGADLPEQVSWLSDGRLIMVLLLVGAILFVGLTILFGWISWRFRRYRIAHGVLEYREGVVMKQQRRAPLARVQTADLTRTVLARIFGLSELHVKTAGNSGDVKLGYLSHKDATELRDVVLNLSAEAQGLAKSTETTAPDSTAELSGQDPDPSEAQPVGEVESPAAGGSSDNRVRHVVSQVLNEERDGEVLAKVKPKTLVLSTLLQTWWMLLITIAVIVAAFVFENVAIAAAVIPTVFGFFSTMWGNLNAGWNFTISRMGDAVRMTQGLTALSTETLRLRRVQAIEISQPLAWRPFKWWRVRMNVPGGVSDTTSVKNVLRGALPVGKAEDAITVVNALLEGQLSKEEIAETMSVAAKPHSRWLQPTPRAWLFWWGARKRAGVRMTEDHATYLLNRGVIIRRAVFVPLSRVQSIAWERGPLLRMMRAARIRVHSATGGMVFPDFTGLDSDQSERLFAKLREATVTAQLAESQARTDQTGRA